MAHPSYRDTEPSLAAIDVEVTTSVDALEQRAARRASWPEDELTVVERRPAARRTELVDAVSDDDDVDTLSDTAWPMLRKPELLTPQIATPSPRAARVSAGKTRGRLTRAGLSWFVLPLIAFGLGYCVARLRLEQDDGRATLQLECEPGDRAGAAPARSVATTARAETSATGAVPVVRPEDLPLLPASRASTPHRSGTPSGRASKQSP
jgi:hypothetical protein